ncbi:alpha/beta hydrolase [Shewanella corallii]|uniref:Proline iminopeptidase n=1 Tax=Shewanella corallii TaxID=560080 RepID=A0ABT0NA04_9GAMM|nr:alpha/beta fold hydrolase [Shewanella corallii]MCL2915298.1 alpha/beta hydrolase [Shewanella corallii]
MQNKLFSKEWLPVSDGHSLHLARYGHPEGKPVLCLHGGPGTGCLPGDLAVWGEQKWQVIMMDQRGAGLSKPWASTDNNDFSHLLQDIEAVRHHFGFDSWHLAGGSFGATLGLLYAALYPERVEKGLFWGLFIPSAAGVNWLYGESGAALLFPDAYHRFSDRLQPRLRELLVNFSAELQSADESIRDAALRRWIGWESELAMPGSRGHWESTGRAQAMAAIQLHYAMNDYFDGAERWQQMLAELKVPCWILQGENDWVSPTTMLRRALEPGPDCLSLEVVPAAHHSLADPRMFRAVHRAVATLYQE